VQGRSDRRRHGFNRNNDLQQPLFAPQRRYALGPQRPLPAGLGDAGDDRVQPLRRKSGAAHATVQTRVHPRGQQRLHAMGDVRHRGKCEAHDQQPGKPLHCAGGSRRETDYEAAGRRRRGVERLELAVGRGCDAERRVFRGLRR